MTAAAPLPPSAAGPASAAPIAPRRVLVAFCCGDLARAFLSGLVTSYLMVIFIPASTSTLPVLLPAAAATFMVVRGVGSLVDAVIDPFIAQWSDTSRNPRGRRVPYLRWFALPWAASTALLVLTPTPTSSWINTIWVGALLLVNVVTSSLYLVPYSAMQAELVTDTRRRVWFYTVNTLFFVVGSAVVFTAPVLKGALVDAGCSELAAWRIAFGFFSLLGAISAVIPAFIVDEPRWVRFTPSYVPLWESFRATLRYPNFVVLLLAYLVMWVAFSLFNATLLYYVTMLIGAPEAFATVVSGLAIVVGVASYWPINRLAARYGKKPLMVGACAAYAAIYTAIFLSGWVITAIPPIPFAVAIGLLIGFPISVTNILPSAAFADLTQYDALVTGVDRAGMFFASRNFITSLGQTVVLFITPLLVAIGSTSGHATVTGVRLTALVAAIAIAVSLLLYARYDDRGITAAIDARAAGPAAGSATTDSANAGSATTSRDADG